MLNCTSLFKQKLLWEKTKNLPKTPHLVNAQFMKVFYKTTTF